MNAISILTLPEFTEDRNLLKEKTIFVSLATDTGKKWKNESSMFCILKMGIVACTIRSSFLK